MIKRHKSESMNWKMYHHRRDKWWCIYLWFYWKRAFVRWETTWCISNESFFFSLFFRILGSRWHRDDMFARSECISWDKHLSIVRDAVMIKNTIKWCPSMIIPWQLVISSIEIHTSTMYGWACICMCMCMYVNAWSGESRFAC